MRSAVTAANCSIANASHTCKTQAGRLAIVETNKGASFEADAIVFNLPPWDAAALLENPAQASNVSLRCGRSPEREASLWDRATRPPVDGWGAFMLYIGLAGSIVPEGAPLHHQALVREPLGEGNSVFLSLSLPDDRTRAPQGHPR